MNRLLSLAPYVPGLALLAASLVLSFTGGFVLRIGGGEISVQSWKVLRVVAFALLLAVAVDPRRRERLQAVTGFGRRHRRALLGSGVAYAAVFCTAFKIKQHLSFHTGAYDLSMFHHAIHNTLRGDLMLAYGLDRSLLSEHFAPVLFLLIPPYALFPSPITLLVVEALVVVAAVIPLFGIARHHGLTTLTSALVCVIYLTNAVLWRGFVFDFHMELFAPLAIFGLVLAFLRGRTLTVVLWLLFTLSIKEEMVVVAAGLAVTLLVTHRERWRLGLGILGLSIAWGVAALVWAIPAAYPEAREVSHLIERWGHLGDSYREIVHTLLARPGYLLGCIFSPPMASVMLSLLYLPLLAPELVLAALPSFLLHLTSGYGYEATLGVYYGLPGTTLLFVALARGLARVSRRFDPRIAIVLAGAALLAEPRGRWCDPVTAEDRRARDLVTSLPEEESISAQTCFVPHLPVRQEIRIFPDVDGADRILVHLERNFWPLTRSEHRRRIEAILEGTDYGVVAQAGGLVVLRRNAPTDSNRAVLAHLATVPVDPGRDDEKRVKLRP